MRVDYTHIASPQIRDANLITTNMKLANIATGNAIHQSTTIKSGLVDVKGLLEQGWPDQSSRPSIRWAREMQARRVIPHIRIGGKVFFEVDRVMAALRRMEIACL